MNEIEKSNNHYKCIDCGKWNRPREGDKVVKCSRCGRKYHAIVKKVPVTLYENRIMLIEVLE